MVLLENLVINYVQTLQNIMVFVLQVYVLCAVDIGHWAGFTLQYISYLIIHMYISILLNFQLLCNLNIYALNINFPCKYKNVPD